MSLSVPFQAVPLHTGQLIFTVLAVLAFALGSVLMSLYWLWGDFAPSGKVSGADGQALGRTLVFAIVWSVTMLTVWVFSTIALLLAKQWILASFSLLAAFIILYGVWFFVAKFMLNTSGVMFTAVFIMLNIGAIWLASWFLRS